MKGRSTRSPGIALWRPLTSGRRGGAPRALRRGARWREGWAVTRHCAAETGGSGWEKRGLPALRRGGRAATAWRLRPVREEAEGSAPRPARPTTPACPSGRRPRGSAVGWRRRSLPVPLTCGATDGPAGGPPGPIGGKGRTDAAPPALRRGGRTTAARLPGRAGRRAPDAVSGERRRPERSPPSPAARRTRGPVEGAARSGAAPSGSPRGGRPQRFRDGPRGRGDSAARPAEVEGREPGGGGARSERRRNERSGPGPWVPALRPAGVGAPPCRQSGGGPRRERDRDRERETRPRPCPPEGDGERLPG